MWFWSAYLLTPRLSSCVVANVPKIETATSSPRVEGNTPPNIQSDTPDNVTSLDQKVTSVRDMVSQSSRLVPSRPGWNTSSKLG